MFSGQRFAILAMFFTPFLPHVWDSLSLTSFNFSGSRFRILTKGVKLQPLWGQPQPNSAFVLGMEQPRAYTTGSIQLRETNEDS